MPTRARLILVAAVLLVVLVPTSGEAQQSEADVFVAEAILAYEEKRYDDALARLAEALARDPGHADALYYQGLVRIARGDVSGAIESLQRARARVPADPAIAYQLGLAYFAQQRYDEATPLLEQVFAERPRTDGAGYYVGFLRYRRREYEAARRAFETGVATDPQIQQLARFYGGLALAALGLPERAAAEIGEAVRLAPSTSLTGPAERLRAEIQAAREPDRRLHVELRVGFLYDTNVSVSPEPSHDLNAEILRRQGQHHTPGELFGARFEYGFLRAGPWAATVAYQYFQTINQEAHEFDVQSHTGSLAATFTGAAGTLPFQLGAQYVYDYLTVGGDEFLQRNSLIASGTLVESALHLTSAQLRLQLKEFSSDAHILRDERRDAANYLLGLVHVVRFAGDRHLIRAGYQFDVERAEGRNFDYSGHRASVGGQYTLPWLATRLKYDYDVHFRDYRHAHSLLPVVAPGSRERYDVEQTHTARAEIPLPLSLTLAPEYQRIVARSNLPLFSFSRHVWSLTLSWQY